MKHTVVLLLFAAGAAAWLVGCGSTRSAYASAPYTVVRADGRFEIRDYPALLVVETPVSRGGRGGDGSFMRLFHFISGENAAKEKIAMTTPVFMAGGESNRTMAFVLPASMTSGAVPRPADDAVSVRQLPAGRFAVLRFSGARSEEQENARLAELQAWMAAQGLKGEATPVYGYFDPPWTPSPLRRNEVMLPLVPAG